MGNVFGTSDVQAKVSELVIELHFWAKIAMNFHLAVDFRIVCPIVRQTSFFCVTTLRKHVLARATSSSSRVLSHEAWRGSFKIPCSSVRSKSIYQQIYRASQLHFGTHIFTYALARVLRMQRRSRHFIVLHETIPSSFEPAQASRLLMA